MDRPSIPLFAFLTTYRDQHSSQPTDITDQLLHLIDVVEIDHAGVDIIVAGKLQADLTLTRGLALALTLDPHLRLNQASCLTSSASSRWGPLTSSCPMACASPRCTLTLTLTLPTDH